MFLLIIWDINFVLKLVYSLKYFQHKMQTHHHQLPPKSTKHHSKLTQSPLGTIKTTLNQPERERERERERV